MDTSILILLCIAAFAAGFVDAIVGGGGLIQTPMGLILLPNLPVATVIGTLKIPSFSGTLFAAIQYMKKVEMNWKLLLIMMVLAVPSAFAGSTLLTYVSNDFMKPLLLVVLSLLVIYTYAKKNFGQHTDKSHSPKQQLLYAVLISFFIGFYDGFIGPGTGSFLVLAFITLLGFDFLHASANAKMVNLATNFGSICLFIIKGKIIWMVAIPMAICNAIGGFIGAKLAINRGNKFIRIFFLIVIIGTLIRFGYDVFIGK
ncbi:sulfite exporter TauE/SafE family protein [Flavobacterium sp.]|uniref:sulfite exporter TauE/SafE family protein n=1 Tax=Flavobacterium sp. TaxID=239 RepID=UPI002B4B5183|nr:TSUP family transporter [Flavobacterium sp.]HLF51470.1 TSUP family transporter [Flavobacterium sp.]